MRAFSIAAIPADGTGPEVISAGVRVLDALARRVGDLDGVIVRENSEDAYSGRGGRAHRGLPEEVGTATARAVTDAVIDAVHASNV